MWCTLELGVSPFFSLSLSLSPPPFLSPLHEAAGHVRLAVYICMCTLNIKIYINIYIYKIHTDVHVGLAVCSSDPPELEE